MFTLHDLLSGSASDIESFINGAETDPHKAHLEVDKLRQAFPTMARILVDERDEHMAGIIFGIGEHEKC